MNTVKHVDKNITKKYRIYHVWEMIEIVNPAWKYNFPNDT